MGERIKNKLQVWRENEAEKEKRRKLREAKVKAYEKNKLNKVRRN